MSESLKGLRKAVGGGAMVHAIGDFTRELNLLGDSTESTVRQFVGSFNTLFAALGTGNPTIVAIVGAIELFSTTSGLFKKSLDDMVKASQDALKNLEDRVKKAKEFRGNVEKWESEQAEEALLGSGDENALRKKYFEQQIRREQIARDLAYEKQMAGTVGWDEQAANRLVEEDKNLAASIKRIQEVLKRSYLGKQMTEQAGFTEKKEEHEKNEKERQSYIDFLIELQNQKD